MSSFSIPCCFESQPYLDRFRRRRRITRPQPAHLHLHLRKLVPDAHASAQPKRDVAERDGWAAALSLRLMQTKSEGLPPGRLLSFLGPAPATPELRRGQQLLQPSLQRRRLINLASSDLPSLRRLNSMDRCGSRCRACEMRLSKP
eukprot:328398-Chlamydomonas_euryale.AAC.1